MPEHAYMRLDDRIERLERERDEYQAKVHELEERVRQMTSAASSAAASTVTALERVLELQAIVDAAVDWQMSRQTHYDAAEKVLWDLVKKWRSKKEKMS